MAGLSLAGSLEDYISHPPAVDNPPWREGCEPSVAIPRWQKQLKEAKTDTDRAIAVGNLEITAARMATLPVAQAAAMELMDQHVMPNVEVTKSVDRTLFCSWRRLMLDCANVYKKLGNIKAERRCLEMYIEGVDLPQDRDFGLYLLAHHMAAQENYAEAIQTIQKVRDDGHMSESKKFIIPKWSKKLALKKADEAKKLKSLPTSDPSKNEKLQQ